MFATPSTISRCPLRLFSQNKRRHSISIFGSEKKDDGMICTDAMQPSWRPNEALDEQTPTEAEQPDPRRAALVRTTSEVVWNFLHCSVLFDLRFNMIFACLDIERLPYLRIKHSQTESSGCYAEASYLNDLVIQNDLCLLLVRHIIIDDLTWLKNLSRGQEASYRKENTKREEHSDSVTSYKSAWLRNYPIELCCCSSYWWPICSWNTLDCQLSLSTGRDQHRFTESKEEIKEKGTYWRRLRLSSLRVWGSDTNSCQLCCGDVWGTTMRVNVDELTWSKRVRKVVVGLQDARVKQVIFLRHRVINACVFETISKWKRNVRSQIKSVRTFSHRFDVPPSWLVQVTVAPAHIWIVCGTKPNPHLTLMWSVQRSVLLAAEAVATKQTPQSAINNSRRIIDVFSAAIAVFWRTRVGLQVSLYETLSSSAL